MIWDLHTHLNRNEGRTPEEMMARLIEVADRMEIDRVCVYMGSPHTVNPTPERLREENDQVLQALEHWSDRAFGFVYVSGEHVETSLAEIDRCVKNGPMVGIKLWTAMRCSDERIDPIILRAAELKAVIFQHTWIRTDGLNMVGESTPEDLAALARRHPDIPLICGHTGGTWELGIRSVRDLKNVSIDIAGCDPTNGMVEMAYRELGAERIIYGSDAPGRSFSSQLAKVFGAEIPEEAKQQILGPNLRRMMLPILKAKGIKA